MQVCKDKFHRSAETRIYLGGLNMRIMMHERTGLSVFYIPI